MYDHPSDETTNLVMHVDTQQSQYFDALETIEEDEEHLDTELEELDVSLSLN